MPNPFFDHPILNSPYEFPLRHWELDGHGQPTQKGIENRRRAEFITPIPKPKKRRGTVNQQEFVFDEGAGLSTKDQQYDPTSMINEVREHVSLWRGRRPTNPRHGDPDNSRPLLQLQHPHHRPAPPLLSPLGRRATRRSRSAGLRRPP